MFQFDLHWDGIPGWKASLEMTAANVDKASQASLVELAALAESTAKGNFQGAHARGRPHTGGAQPNIVTGNLRRSIQQTAMVSPSRGEYMTRVFPSTVYARAVEMGNPRTGSRAFPYFAPAMRVVRLAANDILIRNWSRYI